MVVRCLVSCSWQIWDEVVDDEGIDKGIDDDTDSDADSKWQGQRTDICTRTVVET